MRTKRCVKSRVTRVHCPGSSKTRIRTLFVPDAHTRNSAQSILQASPFGRMFSKRSSQQRSTIVVAHTAREVSTPPSGPQPLLRQASLRNAVPLPLLRSSSKRVGFGIEQPILGLVESLPRKMELL